MTTDILQRIAKCAPPEMGAKFGTYLDGQPYVDFWGVRDNTRLSAKSCVTLWLNDEVAGPNFDAQACFAMLDAMEKAGVVVWLSLRVYCEDLEDDRLDVDGYECSGYRLKGLSANFEVFGPTRAIAIGEAFCQVFEVKG